MELGVVLLGDEGAFGALDLDPLSGGFEVDHGHELALPAADAEDAVVVVEQGPLVFEGAGGE